MNLLNESNRLASILSTEIKKSLIKEDDDNNKRMNLIVIYAGYFNPFHTGNYNVYNHLITKFGQSNVYIDILGNVNLEEEQKIMISLFKIDITKIKHTKSIVRPNEIFKNKDPETTAYLLVLSEDDKKILESRKEYFKPFDAASINHLKSFDSTGYYLLIPEPKVIVGKQKLSDEQLNKLFHSSKLSPEMKEKLFVGVYGSKDDGIFNSLTKTEKAEEPSDEKDKKDKDETEKDSGPITQKMIVNPETGKEIKIASALKYPRWKPVYKKANSILKSHGVDRKDRVKDPEVNQRYRARAKKMNKEHLIADLSDAIVEDLTKELVNNKISITTPELGEVTLFLEETAKRPVVIYAGRFQPYHAGHHHAYQDLTKKFGKDNVYIATSNKTDPEKSPFNFDEKKKIISQMFGINPSHIIYTKNPYKAEEITSNLPKDTPVIWALGKKDAERLQGAGKYFQTYDQNKPMKGFEENGYVYLVPQLPMKIGNQVISGSAIRSVFSKGSPEQKKTLFTKLYGKEDPEIFNMIANKTTDKSSIIKHLKDKIVNPETKHRIQVKTALSYDKSHPAHQSAMQYLKQKGAITENFLVEGGAYGHMTHLYEDPELTFGDLKQIVTRSLGQGLNKEGPVAEKTDGQNIMFTVRDGKVLFARSVNHLKNRGQNAMTSKELKQKFAGRGSLEHTFGSAGEDLQSAVSMMPSNMVQKIFQNGKNFMSAEIIHPSTENTIPYNKKVLILHHTIEFDNNGQPIGHNPENSELMADILHKNQADKQKEFGIQGQHLVVFDDSENEKYQQKMEEYIQELNKLEDETGLRDRNTIADYKIKRWNVIFNNSGLKMSPEDKELLMRRWVMGQKSSRLQTLSSPDVINWAKTIDSNIDEIDGEIIYPLKKMITKLGIDTISRSTELLSANNPLAAQQLKLKLHSAIEKIQQLKDPNKLDQMNKFLDLMKDVNLDKIVPSEGLIFPFGNKIYKLTGAFAPLNRILGIVKYEAPSAKQSEKPTKDKSVPKHIARILNKRIQNPETGNKILVKTALGYDPDQPVRKAAEKLVRK